MATMNLTTELPTGMTVESLVSTMHDHAQMIRALVPDLVDYQKQSGDENNQATYEVTDRKPFGKTTYKLTLTNVPEGVDSKVMARPPMGPLTITAQFRVKHTHLTEEIHIDGNFLTKKFAKGNVEKTHPEQHQKLLEMARV